MNWDWGNFWQRLSQGLVLIGKIVPYLMAAEVVGVEIEFAPIEIKNVGGRDFKIKPAASGSGNLAAVRTR